MEQTNSPDNLDEPTSTPSKGKLKFAILWSLFIAIILSCLISTATLVYITRVQRYPLEIAVGTYHIYIIDPDFIQSNAIYKIATSKVEIGIFSPPCNLIFVSSAPTFSLLGSDYYAYNCSR